MNSYVLLAANSNPALITFLVYTLAVFGLAALSNRLLKSRSFLSEYFLGSRSLGVWAFALTFAATSASGGSFTGFPAKIYNHGWVLALWIASYMVVPICTMGLLGKRINQVARISGAITIPDVIRDRFRSTPFGLTATALIIFFMSFNLIAQFKAGSLILRTLLAGVTPFENAAQSLGTSVSGLSWFAGVEAEYLLCLLAFGIAVILYTTWGGFHAVVWTDVMQGVVMVFGVLILLPLALSEVGGLERATQQMAKMTPPNRGEISIVWDGPPSDSLSIPVRSGEWIFDRNSLRLFRTTRSIVMNGTDESTVAAIEITTKFEKERIVTDANRFPLLKTFRVTGIDVKTPAYPTEAGTTGSYVTGPGPHKDNIDGFLPLSLAISFFFMWAISGAGQPSNMIRLMAFNNTRTLRRSIMTVAIYYSAIYFPLVIIFCCARVIMPGMEGEPDQIMPALAVFLTERAGAAWLAGLLVAAPFAAVMSTVDSFLLMISSALVRDIYQRNINPAAQEKTIRKLCYLSTLIVGTLAMLGAVNPPQFLQDIIVYTGSGLAACFLAPVVFGLYWPRVTSQGALAGMLAGFASHFCMYGLGLVLNGNFFSPYRFLNLDPILIGLFVSFLTVYVVSRSSAPPPADLVAKYFHKPTSARNS